MVESEINQNKSKQLPSYQGVLTRTKQKLTNSIPSKFDLTNNNSISMSTSNIFETPFERNIRKRQELVLEGKNNQKIIYESERHNSIAGIEEESIENKDLSRLYQSIDNKINGFKNLINSNNLDSKNRINTNSLRDLNNSNNNNMNNYNTQVNNPSNLANTTNLLINNFNKFKQYNLNSKILNNVDGKKYKLNFFKFMALKESCKINIINFMEPQDYYCFSVSCKAFYNVLIETLLCFSKQIVDNFNSQYKRMLHAVKPVMIVNKHRDFKGKRIYINLIIQAEVFSNKLANNTISIAYLSKFYSDKTSHSNLFRFDVIESNTPANFWLMREYTSVSFYIITIIFKNSFMLMT